MPAPSIAPRAYISLPAQEGHGTSLHPAHYLLPPVKLYLHPSYLALKGWSGPLRIGQDPRLTRQYSLSIHITPMQQSSPLFPHPEARFYTASSIASSASHERGPTLDHPLQRTRTHNNRVWELVHTQGAVYAPVPPSLRRKRPTLPSAHSSSSSSSTFSRRSPSPWYDYNEFNGHPRSQGTAPAADGRPPSH